MQSIDPTRLVKIPLHGPLRIGLTADQLDTSTNGSIFSLQTWMSGARLLLEALRGNSAILLGSLCLGQIQT